MAPAIEIAERGYAVPVIVQSKWRMASEVADLVAQPGFAETFLPRGRAPEVGELFRPDVILMDLGMPRLNGFEACARIRMRDWGKDLAIVAMTGWGQDHDRERSRVAGFDHHLVKPVEPMVLESVLATLPKRGRTPAS